MRYVVGSLHRSYGDNTPHAPLAAWYDCYDDLPALKADLLTLSRRLCDQHDDALTRYVRAALGDTEDFLFDFTTGYVRPLRDGSTLEQRGCAVKRSPFTFLLMELGFKAVMHGESVAHLNDQPSHSVVIFDPTATHTVTNVAPCWKATYRSVLLYRATRATRRATREQDEQRAAELQAFISTNLHPPASVEDHRHSLPLPWSSSVPPRCTCCAAWSLRCCASVSWRRRSVWALRQAHTPRLTRTSRCRSVAAVRSSPSSMPCTRPCEASSELITMSS